MTTPDIDGGNILDKEVGGKRVNMSEALQSINDSRAAGNLHRFLE
jgi:hypothetical protein